MGFKQGVCKCFLFHLMVCVVVALIAIYHLIFLPDVDALIRHVPPRHQSQFSSFPLKSQIKRQSRIIEACANYSSVNQRLSSNFLIEPSTKIAYCFIPKVGCTNWKRALILATGKISEHDLNQVLEPRSVNLQRNPSSFIHSSRALFWKFGIYHSDEYIEFFLRQLLPTYFKFLFVRCPYQRILSAYRDKFEKVDHINKIYYQKTYGVEIVKRYRHNPSQISSETGSDVTFPEFLQFITDSSDEGRALDRHWRPYYSLCDPCLHNFDFIGKLETLEEDSEYVLSRLGGRVQFPSSMSGPSSDRYAKNNSATFHDYYSQIPPALLQRLTDTYSKDFEMFGYEKDITQCSKGL